MRIFFFTTVISLFYILLLLISLGLISSLSSALPFMVEEDVESPTTAVIFTGLFILIGLFAIARTQKDFTVFTVPPVVYVSATLLTLYFMFLNMGDLLFEQVEITFTLLAFMPALSIGLSGILEEVIFRGLYLRALLNQNFHRNKLRNDMTAIFIVSVFFGLIHITNFFFSENSVFETSAQIIYAVFFGVCFGLVYVLCNRSILVVSIVHFLTNFSSDLSTMLIKDEAQDSSITDFWLSVTLVSIPLLLVSWVLFRKLRQRYTLIQS